MADENYRPLQYAPFNSCVHPGFWNALSKAKLEILGLDEKPIKAKATFLNNDAPGLPSRLSVEWDAITVKGEKEAKPNVPQAWNSYQCSGSVTNLNTLDAFKTLDKSDFISRDALQIWRGINDETNGSALQRPDYFLNRFSVLMHADLKRYHYYYWFAFPAFVLPTQIKIVPASSTNNGKNDSTDRDGNADKCWTKTLDRVHSEKTCETLSEAYQLWKKSEKS